MIVLAGDIGGTHARFAIVEIGPGGARIVREASLPSQGAPGLAPLVQAFLEGGADRPTRACFAVAGAVQGGSVKPTNLPWTIDEKELGATIGVPDTRLINDFEAVGYGLVLLRGPDLATLQAGERDPHGPIALIGAGTGLGEGVLLWQDGQYRVHASEGGHTTFAATNPTEWGLVRSLAERFGHVSWERVLSGPGLVNVYEYLVGVAGQMPDASVQEELKREDPASVITRHGLAGTDPVSVEALDTFVRAYGAQAGNLALTVLATGGVYLAGGIAPRILPRLLSATFLDAFRHKGRLEHVLARMPVHVIVNTDVGLLGSAARAAQ